MSLIAKFNRMEKYTKYSVLIIILFSIIALALTSIYHVSGDGCWHMPAGKFIAENNRFPLFEPLGRDEPFWSPPLYHVIVAAVYSAFSAFGSNAAEFAVKFVSPIFGILSLIFSFLVIRKLVNEKIAFYSTIFLASVPIFIDYSILSYAESTLVFFVILSVYFLVKGRIALAGIAAGLAILAKYNGAFIVPVLLYILYKKHDRKEFAKKSAIILLLALLTASPWLIRNWALLGNPIWPFLNFGFEGYQAKSYSAIDFSRLFNPNLLTFTYLGFFGVPDGNYMAFSLVKIPYIMYLLPVWIIGTLVFLIPLAIGLLKKPKGNQTRIVSLWIVCYLVLFLIYAVNVGFSVSRMLLPAFPAIAIIWAFGLDRMMNSKLKNVSVIFIILIASGFLIAESAKIKIASDAWNSYREDFEWVKRNTSKDSVFIASGQCIPYNIQRKSLHATEKNLDKADYIWVNQNFWLDRKSIINENLLKSVQSGYKIAHENKATGTTIYSIKQ